MTVNQLLRRFAWVYVLAIVAVAFLLSLLDSKTSSANTAALLASALYVCLRFAEVNQRRLNADESRRAWLGMWGIDAVLQLAILLLTQSLNPSMRLTSGVALLAIGFVLLLHGVVLWGTVKYSGWLHDKQTAAKARKAARKAARRSVGRTGVPPIVARATHPSDFSDTVPTRRR